MTVVDLISVLLRLDQSAPVYVRGYEDGVNDILEIRQIRVNRDANRNWYQGQHEIDYDATHGQYGYELKGLNMLAE